MSRPHDEESEFKEFIDQINALQQMQGTEQEELNQQRRLNVDLMEDLVKSKRKLEAMVGQYTRLNFRQAQLEKENHEHQQLLNSFIRENEELLGKEIDLRQTLDTLKRKHHDESRFYRTHIERLDRLSRIKESYLASLECSRRLKEIQHQLFLTNNLATLLSEENAVDQQMASTSSPTDDEVAIARQSADLSASVSLLSDRVTKARDALQTAQVRANERSAMQREDYNSTMAEVVHLDRESQQLESLLEQERIETEALKFELADRNQMIVD